MKQNDIFAALSFVDDELTERAHKTMQGEHKYKKIAAWKRWSMIAACVCLILVGAIALLLASPIVSGKIYLSDFTLQPQKLTASLQEVSESIAASSTQAEIPDGFAYINGMIVVAKIEEVLPDRYAGYYIWRLSVQEVIRGTGIPKEIYYRLPSCLDPDLREYDFLVIAMKQVGFENYVMLNEIQGRYEAFPYMFETTGSFDRPERGAVLPFKEGVFDMSLWNKKGWDWYKANMERWAKEGNSSRYQYIIPAGLGETLDYSKEKINEIYAGYILDTVVHDDSYVNPCYQVLTNDVFASDKAKAALAYIAPFENGVFLQSQYTIGKRGTNVTYTRVIDGCVTNERVYIDALTGEVEYSENQFTREELECLPNLRALIASLDVENIRPPHTKRYDNMSIHSTGVSARYIKNDGVVYGLVKITWEIAVERRKFSADIYLDDLYLLVMPDGSYRPVEREQLSKYLGDEYSPRTEEYNKVFRTEPR